MGVTTEVWRSRIGSFLPIIRSLSNCERRNWPSRKLYRTYNRPPEPSITHHLSLNILLTLLSLTLALIVSRTHPFDHVKKLKFHQVMLDVLAVHFAVFHNHRTKRHSAGTWQECINITAAIRMVMFVLLLLCGDIESNPGPNEHQQMDTRQKKAHKIERMDTNEKIGISSSTLDRLWSEVCSRWDDVTIDDFKLTEADGTELVDEFYYQQLASKIPLQLKSKTKGTKSRSKYARVNARPLTDDIIHEISTNHITHDIVKFGLAMGFKLPSISKYKADNDKEPRAESRGTQNMIMYWRRCCRDADKVGAFCNVLQQAELNELADDLSNGVISSRGDSGPDISSMSQTEVGRSKNDSVFSIHGSPVDHLEVDLGPDVAPTQPTNSPTSMSSSLPACMGDGNLQNMASSTSQLGACSSDTAQISQASSSASMGDGNLQSMASSTSQLGACSSDTTQISQASSKVDTSPDVTQDEVIDTTYPIVLFSLCTLNQPEHLFDDLRRQLPGKTIILITDIHDLTSNMHLFEVILLDFGALQEVASCSSAEYMGALDIYQKCLKEMLVPQNVALLIRAPANTHSASKRVSDIISMISKISKTTETPVFQYDSESCRPSLFDNNTKSRLDSWLLHCYKRSHAASLIHCEFDPCCKYVQIQVLKLTTFWKTTRRRMYMLFYL